MQLTCPNCGATYDVPETAIGPNGRKIRCRACDTSWFEAPRTAEATPVPVPPRMGVPEPIVANQPAPAPESFAAEDEGDEEPPRPRRRVPWLLILLAVLVLGLGGAVAAILWGPQQVASRLGIGEHRVPLGIQITREPDWRMIAGGSQLFAVSGRIWNPTNVEQAVPDIRAELKDASGKTVYAWTITRPVARLGPGQQTGFDGAAVDVPASSTNVAVSFAGTTAR